MPLQQLQCLRKRRRMVRECRPRGEAERELVTYCMRLAIFVAALPVVVGDHIEIDIESGGRRGGAGQHLWDDTAQRLWRRPEANARAMSDRMLDEWKATVGADDLMLCLGDVAHPFGLADPKLAARLRAAPGRRLLVLGNHDVHRGRMLGEAGFERMCAVAVRAGCRRSCSRTRR